jgi:xylulokinase
VMNLIIWMDGRGGRQALELYERHPTAFETWVDRHGMVPLPSGNDSLSHLLYVQHERPDVYERTYKFLEPMDFLIAKLTGTCSANLCTAFPLLLTDNRNLAAREYDAELLSLSGVDREKLPDLLPVNAIAGTLRADLAAELDLPAATKVFSGVNDTQAVSVGAATFQGSHGGINIGTTSQVLAHVGSKKSDLANAILSMPSPIAGRYMVMAENGLGAKTLDHFLRNIAFASDALANHSTEEPFGGLDQAVAAAPPGSGGLLFLPWLSGAQAPEQDPNARGGFLNLSLGTTRTHMVRAILEGVSYNLRWLLPAVESFVERPFDELLFAGGGAVSDEWSQIMADVMNRPVGQLADARHVNNRATAFLAFVELGVLGLDDIGTLCRIKRRYEPRPQHHEIYDKMFTQFVAAFQQNRPIFEALNG